MAGPTDGFDTTKQGVQLFNFATGPLSKLRTALGLPFLCHDFYRPPAYNILVGGAPASAHQALGAWAAVDFDVGGSVTCDRLRSSILELGYLEQFGLRMENRPGSGWVHIGNDIGRGSAFFTP